MLIMDESEIKKLALGGQEFIKKPDTTDYWDYYVGTIIYDIALSNDENYLYIFYATGIQKVDCKGKLIWTFSNVSGISHGTVTPDGYVVFSASGSTTMYSIKDEGQSFGSLNVITLDGTATALVSNSNSRVYIGLGKDNSSIIGLCDLSNNKVEHLTTINTSAYIMSLCLNSNFLIATTTDEGMFVFNLSTKELNTSYPFSQSQSGDTTAFASCNEDKIVYTSGLSGEIVILDTNSKVITRQNPHLGAIQSNLILKDELYINMCAPGNGSPDIYKFDLNLNKLMSKNIGMNAKSKLIYSNKDDALYMAHNTYYTGKFSTYFA